MKKLAYLYKRALTTGKYLKPDDPEPGWYWMRYRERGKLNRLSLDTTSLNEAVKARDKHLLYKQLVDDEEHLLVIKAKIERNKSLQKGAKIALRSTTAVADAWKAYLAQLKKTPVQATLNTYYGQWSRFAGWLPKTVRSLDEIDTAVATQYGNELAGTSMTGATYNKHLDTCGRVLRALTGEDPFAEVYRDADHQPETHRRLLDDEVARILAAAEYEDYGVHCCGYVTGLRLKDVCTLSWQHLQKMSVRIDGVRKEVDVIRITPSKTKRTKRRGKKSAVIPAHPLLMAYLNKTPYEWRQGHVFPAVATEYLHDRSIPSRRYTKLFRRCGVNDTEDGKATYHSYRCTLTTKIQEVGYSGAVASSITLHSSKDMVDLYTDIGLDVSYQAIMSLGVPR